MVIQVIFHQELLTNLPYEDNITDMDKRDFSNFYTRINLQITKMKILFHTANITCQHQFLFKIQTLLMPYQEI